MANPQNPLSELTDEQLFETLLTLELACNKSKSIGRSKHRKRICFLTGLVALESANRGKPTPHPPYVA